MNRYRFQFLGQLGETVREQEIKAADDAEALELARLLNPLFAIRVCHDDREVGIVWRGEKAIKASFNQDGLANLPD